MVGHQNIQRLLQGIAMQFTTHLQAQRHMVRPVIRLQLLHKPQPSLRCGTGKITTARHRPDCRHGCNGLTQRGTVLQNRLLEDAVQRQVQLMLMAQTVDHLYGQQ